MLRGIVHVFLVAVVAYLAYFYLDEFFVYVGEPIYLTSVFGKLRGRVRNVRGGGQVYAFTSIPYAKPPVGDLRYEPPTPYGKWEEILDATKKIRLCPQYDALFKKIDGVEDCLQLHIYTPRLNPEGDEKKLLPVMVWFHGGHFMYGGNNLYRSDYLLQDQDVVLVTVNYRLNSFGFLNTGDNLITGNMGLKDQNLALKWIQKGIKAFGGNPSSITLFGNSAGAASVNYHMISPLSKGLFHRGISQSGSSLCPWAFTRDPAGQAKRLAKKLNCSVEPSSELVKCLRGKSMEEILLVHKEIGNIFHDPSAVFGPSIEKTDGKSKGTVFLPDSPTKLYKAGQYNAVPFMAGVTSEEGCFRSPLLLSYEDKLAEINEKWSEVVPNALLLYNDEPALSEKVKQFYFGSRNSAKSAEKGKGQQKKVIEEGIGWNDKESVTNMYSDRYFLGCVRDAAKFHAQLAPTHLYYYTYKPDMSYGYIQENARGRLPNVVAELTLLGFGKYLLYRHVLNWEVNDYGVCHSDEVQSLFNLNPILTVSENSPHYEFSRNIVKLWVSFARDGKPSDFNGVSWTALKYDKASNKTLEPLRYLRLGKVAEMIEEPFTKRLKFWEDLKLPVN